jgi:hypothetical protein
MIRNELQCTLARKLTNTLSLHINTEITKDKESVPSPFISLPPPRTPLGSLWNSLKWPPNRTSPTHPVRPSPSSTHTSRLELTTPFEQLATMSLPFPMVPSTFTTTVTLPGFSHLLHSSGSWFQALGEHSLFPVKSTLVVTSSPYPVSSTRACSVERTRSL